MIATGGDRARRLVRASTLASAAAYAVVITLPLTVVWRNATPVTAAVATVLLAGAVLAAGRQRALFAALRGGATAPFGVVLLVALAYMAVSVSWSLVPGRAFGHLDDVVLTVLIVAMMVAAVPLVPPVRLVTLLPPALALAAVALGLNVFFDGALNASFGRWQWQDYYNRSALGVVLFLPLAATLLWRLQLRLAAVGLALAVAVVAVGSASESASLAVLVMLLIAPASWLWPIATHRVGGLAMLATIAVTPFVIGYANAVVPQSIQDRVGYLTMGIRGDIWSAFAVLYRDRPLFGFGLEGSTFVGRSVVAAGLSEHQRALLDVMHTHSTPLQIWFELGLVGAVLAIVVLALGWRRIEARAGPLLPAATQTGLAAFAIAAISPGAWQAWWLCLLGLVLVAFTMARHETRDG